MTKEYFLKRLQTVHGSRNYQVIGLPDEFTNRITITVICPIHGPFTITVCNLLNGRYCHKCKKEETHITAKEFEKKYKEHYNGKYICDTTKYKSYSNGYIDFYCTKHKKHFQQIPNNSLKYIGCDDCVIELQKEIRKEKDKNTLEERFTNFKEKSEKIHYKKYIYNIEDYVNNKEKTRITCPKHGDFWQTPENHMQGQGCPVCKNKSITFEMFVNLIEEKFGKIYDFAKSEYKNMSTKITVGYNGKYFSTTPSKLLYPKNNKPITHSKMENIDDLIREIKRVYGDKYDTSLIDRENYKGIKSKIQLICDKHGKFDVTVETFVKGCGCPFCRSSLLENEVEMFLNKNNVSFIKEYTLKNTRNKSGYKKLDFFIPEYGIGIECQGEQHFKNINYFGGEDGFKYRVKNDIEKQKKCNEENIKILYFKKKNGTSITKIITNPLFENIYNKNNLFTSLNKLSKEIFKGQ